MPKYEFLKKIRTIRGAILIEALVALLILTVSLTVVIHSLVQGLRATVFCQDYTQAIMLADNKMFELLAQKFIDTTNQEEGTFPDDENFRYSLQSQKLSASDPDSLIQQVDLKVTWHSGMNEKELALVTYFLSSTKEGK